jgi:competence protein ComEA
MADMKAKVKNYFSLTKKEWNGMVVLILLIALVLTAPYIYRLFRKDSTINATRFNAALAQLKKAEYVKPASKSYTKFSTTNSKSSKPKAFVELNTADSAHLTAIDGIGPAFAKRIIYYRERIGGFISKEQLKEVFGIDELKYKQVKDQVKVDASRIHYIKINTITFDKLRLMPYLNYKQVSAVIEYRKQHSNYTSIDDVKNIAIIDEVILRKIEPYLSFK